MNASSNIYDISWKFSYFDDIKVFEHTDIFSKWSDAIVAWNPSIGYEGGDARQNIIKCNWNPTQAPPPHMCAEYSTQIMWLVDYFHYLRLQICLNCQVFYRKILKILPNNKYMVMYMYVSNESKRGNYVCNQPCCKDCRKHVAEYLETQLCPICYLSLKW